MIAWILAVVLAIIALALAHALAKARQVCESLRREHRGLLHSGALLNSTGREEPLTAHRRNLSWSRLRYRLDSLGFASYNDYLNSEHWRQTKQRYFASAYPKHCLVCQSHKVE